MDPITMLVILMFMRRRGREFDELLPLILLMSTGQNPFAGATVPAPTTSTPPTTAAAPPANNQMMMMLLALMAGGEFSLMDMFARRREMRNGAPAGDCGND